MGGYNGKDPKIVQSGVETVPRLTFHPQIILLKKTAPFATRTTFFNEIAATESEVPESEVPGPLPGNESGSASPGNESGSASPGNESGSASPGDESGSASPGNE